MAAQKPIIITTANWHGAFFSEPQGCGLDMDKFEVVHCDDSVGDNFDFDAAVDDLCEALKKRRGPVPIMTCTDSAMLTHAMAKERLRNLDPAFVEMCGASLKAAVLCDHKLLTRALVPACGGIKYRALMASEAEIPAVDGVPADAPLICKPVAAVGSVGVCTVRVGQASPFHGHESSGVLHRATLRYVEEFGRAVPGAAQAIGLLEQYVDPRIRKVSVDGAMCGGTVVPWAISDNVYLGDRPEVFDALVTPTQLLTPAEQQKVWEVFHRVVTGLQELTDGDFDRQFVCIEMFVFDETQVEVMEVNIRISANQLPLFHRVLENGCPFNAMTMMQQEGRVPPQPRTIGKVGICLYRQAVPGVADFVPALPGSEGDAMYYARTEKLAHVYACGDSGVEARTAAERLYASLEGSDSSADGLRSLL